ncbi:hypothetical protein BDV98DRAFT_566860 [Pterulicium gracile]|uniref:Uncharacterized protein n=1 Tax=Pterulicium gracile TaxID=1884261 RepID=A0A5C3QJX6_9AGAR|nr:hypothetical protein BDV98DRAFT_566860 [Pterula gracilis]
MTWLNSVSLPSLEKLVVKGSSGHGRGVAEENMPGVWALFLQRHKNIETLEIRGLREPWHMFLALGSMRKGEEDHPGGLESDAIPLPSLKRLFIHQIGMAKRAWDPKRHRVFITFLDMLNERVNYGMPRFMLDVYGVDGFKKVVRRIEQVFGEEFVKWELSSCRAASERWGHSASESESD